MKRQIWTLVGMAVIIIGGLLAWKYMGDNDAIAFAKKMINEHALEYAGTSTITLEQYNQIKTDIAQTYPKQTASYVPNYTLTINDTYADTTLNITYDFYSTSIYSNLKSGKIAAVTNLGATLFPILFFGVLVVLAMNYAVKREVTSTQ